MRKRRLYLGLLLLAVAAVVGVLVAGVVHSREPTYGGRSLSQWVGSYAVSIDRGRYTPKQREQAIRGIGTNALPYLLEWIRYETPPWKSKLYGALNPTLRKVKPSWELSDDKEQLRADGAVFALIASCPEPDRAIAPLSKLLNDPTTSPAVHIRAANVLRCIDRRSWNDSRP